MERTLSKLRTCSVLFCFFLIYWKQSSLETNLQIFITKRGCIISWKQFLETFFWLISILENRKKNKKFRLCLGNIFENHFSRTIFENYSLIFCRTKICLGTRNVISLFYMFLNMFEIKLLFIALFLIIFHICIIIF